MSDVLPEIEEFIEDWPESPDRNKQIFIRLKNFLESKTGVIFDFIPRPGITYSLRAKIGVKSTLDSFSIASYPNENQSKKRVKSRLDPKPLFAMVDVIEDVPRWLSVCFYGELITDPDEIGDYVPGGLLGEDAVCFDLEEFDEPAVSYVEARLNEAWQKAAKG